LHDTIQNWTGYGVLGVCNDTAALVDFAVRGSTNMYPLLSTGRFLMHTASHLVDLHEKLSKYDGMKTVAMDARRLASAACFMESDIHCSPTQLIGANRRFNANFPESYFQITDDSREIMQCMSKEYQAFLDRTVTEMGSKFEAAFQEYLTDPEIESKS
jgi:antirestriction protein ArdC